MILQEFILFYLPIIANILIVISIAFNLFGPLLSIRRKTKRDIAELTIADVQESETSLEGSLNVNYRRLEKFYESMRNQNISWFIFSVILFSVGVLVIVASLAIPSYINPNVQIIVLISGALLDVIAVIFFLRTRQASQEIDVFCNEKFLEAEKLSRLIKLISENPNLEARNLLKEKIILQVLIPMKTRGSSENDQPVQNYI